jgi:hypothetical protein
LQRLIFSEEYPEFIDFKTGNFTSNSSSVFFWNNFECWHFSFDSEQLQKIDAYIDNREKDSYIKKVRCGSNSDEILLIVRQSISSDCIILWNMKENTEIEAFDMTSRAIALYDAKGSCYIAEDDRVTVCNQGVSLKSYNVESFEAKKNNLQFRYFKGHRFDYKNHNWILFSEYISLSFSFMTLVIRDKF